MFKKVYLNPENKTLGEVMGNDKSYEVPPFQRDYTWDEDQLDELWQDIQHMQTHKAQHFMGYLVLQSKDNKIFHIIDGQQRIATLTLLIVAILAKFKNLIENGADANDNKRRKDEIHNRYLGVFNVVTLRNSPKVSLNRNNKNHFRDIIDCPYAVPRKRGITSTNRKLNKAFEFFQSQLSAYSGESLAELIEALRDGLLFTAIIVSDDLDAFLVFETLNARGVHLSAPDLLKNYLLSTLQPGEKSDLLDEFETMWSNTLEQLGETNFTAFLRSYEGMFSRLRHKKELYRYLKIERITQPTEIMAYVKDLNKHSSVYAALQNPNDPFWKEYHDQYQDFIDDLAMLKLFGIKTPLSLLMAAYEKFDTRQFSKIVKWLVFISLRYNVICRKSAKEQESIYNKVSMSIMNKADFNLPDIKSALEGVYPSDDEFQSAFIVRTMPGRQSGKKIVYILRAIETHVARGSVPSENLTLEHVLPRNPTSKWQEYFGVETCSDAVDRLANFALLEASQNRDIDQESFESKKSILANSNIKINQKTASYNDWNIETLEGHQKWLARQAKTVWRID